MDASHKQDPSPEELPTTTDGVPMDQVIAAMTAADPGRLVARNEFACVSVQLVGPRGRQRLRIEDLRTRQWIDLDAIELESLAWASHADLDPHLNPSATRWTNRVRASNGTVHDEGDIK